MEQNSVYDIISLLSDKKSIETDLNEIKKLTANYFRKKYFDRFNKIISAEISCQKAHPSDDLRLLYALKPYAPKAAPVMDSIIEAAAAAKAINNIKTKIPAENKVAAASLPSVNDDGVYDTDPDCLIKAASGQNINDKNQSLIYILIVMMILLK
ncbi:MAG: hypothetical protein LUC92_09860 [Clostridiales bacterium]|nr:hypothetical protein [Clostridiales bacterium]